MQIKQKISNIFTQAPAVLEPSIIVLSFTGAQNTIIEDIAGQNAPLINKQLHKNQLYK